MIVPVEFYLKVVSFSKGLGASFSVTDQFSVSAIDRFPGDRCTLAPGTHSALG